MSTTLTIPANVIPDVREGLFCLMGDATQEIDGALIQPERELYPEWFEKDRRRLEDVFALLDLIGWAVDGESREVEVDLREHGRSLKEAVDGYLLLLADQEEEADATTPGEQSRASPHGRTRSSRAHSRSASSRCA
jgi:hypothetical protein